MTEATQRPSKIQKIEKNQDVSGIDKLAKMTFTLTFGDQAENHVGMQKIGTMASDGFHLSDLNSAKNFFEQKGAKCNLINLATYLPEKTPFTGEAYLLHIENGVRYLLPDNTNAATCMFKEQEALPKDEQAFMYGRVVQKKARHNLCFAEKEQEPEYASGKGRIVAFDKVPLLKQLREELPTAFGTKATQLMVEGNYYFDIKKCGIGFHGDAERKRVIGVRLGATLPLHYQ